MQARILSAQILNLCLLNGFDKTLWNKLRLMVDFCQIFGSIKQKGSATTQKWC